MDAAVGEGVVTTVDTATDPDDAVRLGPPGAVNPTYLATMVLSSPMTPASVLARQLLSLPADPDDERAIRYAVDAVITAERDISANVAAGLYGAFQVGGLPMADWWLRQNLAVRLSRPQ